MIFTRLRNRLLGDDRGNVAAEVVMLAPVLILLVLILVAAGRTAMADNATQSAAFSAARAASLSANSTDAYTAAQDAARRSMSQAGIACRSLTINVNTSGLDTPVGTTGTVSARVNCDVNLSDITLPGLPGTRTMSSTAASPVDAYRQRG
jgi:Flp pilus assembly protein TadG